MEEHQSKPLKNISNILGRVDNSERIVLKMSTSSDDFGKCETAVSVTKGPVMDQAGYFSVIRPMSDTSENHTRNDFAGNRIQSQARVLRKEESAIEILVDTSDKIISRNIADVDHSSPPVTAQSNEGTLKTEFVSSTQLITERSEEVILPDRITEFSHESSIAAVQRDFAELTPEQLDIVKKISPASTICGDDFESVTVQDKEENNSGENPSVSTTVTIVDTVVDEVDDTVEVEETEENNGIDAVINYTSEAGALKKVQPIAVLVETSDQVSSSGTYEFHHSRMTEGLREENDAKHFPGNDFAELVSEQLDIVKKISPACTIRGDDFECVTVQDREENNSGENPSISTTVPIVDTIVDESDGTVEGEKNEESTEENNVINTVNCTSEADALKRVQPIALLIKTSEQVSSSSGTHEFYHSRMNERLREDNDVEHSSGNDFAELASKQLDIVQKISPICTIRGNDFESVTVQDREENNSEGNPSVSTTIAIVDTVVYDTVEETEYNHDVKVPVTDDCEVSHFNSGCKVESLVQFDDDCNTSRIMELKVQRPSVDLLCNKNASTASDVLCAYKITDERNMFLNNGGCKIGESDHKEYYKTKSLSESEHEVMFSKSSGKPSNDIISNANGENESPVTFETDVNVDEPPHKIMKFTDVKTSSLKIIESHCETSDDLEIIAHYRKIPTVEKDKSSDELCEWTQLKSSTPSEKFSVSQDDNTSDYMTCQALSTPKRNVSFLSEKQKKIDFLDTVKDQNNEYILGNAVVLPVDPLVNIKMCSEFRNMRNLKENSVKTSEIYSNEKSEKMVRKIKREESPDLEGVKRVKCDNSNQKRIIVVDLTNDLTKDNGAQNAREEPKKSNYANFVSKDPKENEDNNNPEWEILKKLETDDERYKAVRERWRNLIIPDPNKNLTRIHIRSTFKHPDSCRLNHNERGNENMISRKRTASHEPTTSTDHVPVKRARTRSCTSSYESKVQNCRKKMEEESIKLSQEKKSALASNHDFYNKQRSHLMSSNLKYYNNWEFQNRIARLRAQEKQAEAAVHKDFSSAFDRLEYEEHRQTSILNKALKEVEAFHKFYRQLDEDSSKNDCFFLTDVELQDVTETDRLYERFNTFYS